MSLFPRHLRPGDPITIHLRLAPRATSFPLVQVRIIDPLGRSVFEETQQLAASLPEPDLEQPIERRLAEGLAEAPPLLFIAQYLRDDPAQRHALIQVLRDICSSLHWYRQWRVPEDAELGTYRVETATWVDGQMCPSPTAANDMFFVERLTVEGLETRADQAVATVRNHSREATGARLHEYAMRDRYVTANVRRVELAAAAVTEIPLATERAMLAYAEDQGRLWLHGDADPVVVRDPSCAFMPSRESSVVVTSGVSRKSFTLTGPAREIWLQAAGLSRRSELQALGSAAFEALQREGLLREL